MSFPNPPPPPPPPPPPAPPPPVPTPPLNPSYGIIPSTTGPAELISTTIWPHRLLHVASMTSYAREGEDVYNGCRAPAFNILSYTWGYFQDASKTAPPLLVHGVDWPIPSIQTSHFTADTFKQAIRRVAEGVDHRCEWVWVDIACIPQEHQGETQEAILLRGQEIGRQVSIFRRAKESFSWLSSIKIADLENANGRIVDFEDFLITFNKGYMIAKRRDHSAAVQYLLDLHKLAIAHARWMELILKHPWLRSLWTLQEMVLRPDSWVLFDDGLLHLYMNEYSTPGKPSRPWSFNAVKNDSYQVRFQFYGSNKKMLDAVASLVSELHLSSRVPSESHLDLPQETIYLLESLLEKQTERGLEALDVTFPHTVYSIAGRRRARKLQDRIYGIVQTYGIACSPDPPGRDEQAKLHYLEDEFGRQLVAKSPLLSQLFLHGSEHETPRRSWLITQQCIVDDPYWTIFTQRESEHLFRRLKIVEAPANSVDFAMDLSGLAWNLDSFIKAANQPEAGDHLPNLLFEPKRSDRSIYYRGLMLDRHVTKAALGAPLEYSDSYATMAQAADKLNLYFKTHAFGTLSESCARNQSSSMSSCVQVVLLGSARSWALTQTCYVGLVLAPANPTQRSATIASSERLLETEQNSSFLWQRIGLYRWEELYSTTGRTASRFYDLPQPHQFEGLLI